MAKTAESGKPTIHTYNEAFREELSRLNREQRKAVEQIEGPVLVIAGPGTGKTHILAARIGRILMETDTQPHNILCLTFTDAGVQAMRSRLKKLIGTEAHRVHIFTFHSFCNAIIQENLELFGKWDLEPLSDLERVEIVRQMLDELPLAHPLKKGRRDIYFYEKHLHNLFRQMKTENWTAEFISKKIDEYLDGLPFREEFIYKRKQGPYEKGDLKQKSIDEASMKMERLRAAANLLPRYEKLLEDNSRYDYEDMILWVLQGFKEHPSLLSRYQEQYLYFLVDEYQDTNGAQNEVLHRLIDFWESPNVFIVGDDDQSIYEFQGARLKNLVEFHSTFQRDLTLVALEDNYRSSQHILDTASVLIQHNELRIVSKLQNIGLKKILTARNVDFAGIPTPPVLIEYPNRLQEEVAVVEALEKLMKEGFPLDETAVIYAKHRQAERLTMLLEKKGIPFRTKRSANVLHLPLIQNLRLLLEYLHAEFHRPYSEERLLFRILHFDFFNTIPHDLARLAAGLAKLPNPEGKRYWRDAISDEAFLKSLPLAAAQAISDCSYFLEMMLSDYANLSVPAFVERLINRSGMLHRVLNIPKTHVEILLPPPVGASSSEQLQALFSFSSFVKNEAERNPRLKLGRLLEILKNMDANRIQLSNISNLVWESGGQAAGNSGQRVNLLTAHSSKGLEFQKVFMFDCTEEQWGEGNRGGLFQFSFPDTLTMSGEEDSLEARRRLFYVGMTRAKEALQISYSRQSDDGKELQPVVFIDEILDDTGLEGQTDEVSPAAVLEAESRLMLESRPVAEPLEEEALSALLEDFTLSISAMNKYLYCPLSFYYENILKVPQLTSEAANFGLAMHHALHKGFEKLLFGGKGKPITAVDFAKIFEREMHRLQGFFSPGEFKRRLELGRQYLSDYVQRNQSQWPQKAEMEKKFRNVEMEGVPLTGIIDRIDFVGNLDVHLVDYKTGSHQEARFYSPSEKYPEGGSYWRQLVFYKILYENWRGNTHRATSAEISYLEPNDRGEFPRKRIQFEPEDVIFMKGLIADTYNRIMRREFYEGCGRPECSWCSFLKRQKQVDSFSDTEIEGLDD